MLDSDEKKTIEQEQDTDHRWCFKPSWPGDLNTPLAPANHDWRSNPKIDPRIRSFYSNLPFRVMGNDAEWVPLLDSDALGGGLSLSPNEGLTISIHKITSHPESNVIQASVFTPVASKCNGRLPCVVYFHGGGMSHYSSFYNNFQTLGRMICHQGVVVVMPDFRNSATPAQQGEETAAFPGGLNDCVSTVKWARDNAEQLGIDTSRIVCAGESGGGNLAISSTLKLLKEQEDETKQPRLVKGVYVLCPYLRGRFGKDEVPSIVEHAGVGLDFPLDGLLLASYGKATKEENDELHQSRNILAWPGYSQPTDLKGFPPTFIVVNEYDPLRDEGIAFYHTALQAGVRARCTVLSGTTHGVGSYLPNLCPEITREQVRNLAIFAESGEEV